MITPMPRTSEPAPLAHELGNVLRLRMVELFAFAVIVFVARELAGFSYPSAMFVALFTAGALLQFSAQSMWEAIGKKLRWGSTATTHAFMWYSSILDFAVVFGIVYLTGTVESPFLFLLVVPLFFASHTFSTRVTLFVYVTGVVAVVGTLGYLEARHVVAHFNCYSVHNEAYLDRQFVVGSLLVLGGFFTLIVFLSTAFQGHFHSSLLIMRKRARESSAKINELSKLYDISLGINAVMTLETLLKMVAKEATLLLGQPWASIVLFNQHQEITHTAFVGIPENLHSSFAAKMRKGGLTEWLWKNNEPVVINDVLSDKRACTGEFLVATRIRSLIGLPLSNGQHVIGAIYVGDFEKKEFEDKHLRLLAIMSDQLAIAIAKSNLYESIQRKIQMYEKKIESLEKINDLKSEYVCHVSHELRTPLTSIKAYMEALERHIDDPDFVERAEFIEIVSKETDRLIRVVNDILDMSSIEFGQRALEKSSFRINEIVDEVTSMLQPKLKDKSIRVEVDIPANLTRVHADKGLISQVLINLISNAVKYSALGTMIRITAEEHPVDIALSIEDEGIGIPETQREKIFDKYYRVKSPQSRGYDGVGLGLAIVKNIIDRHGGSISVTGREHGGSRFLFTIPKEHCVNDLLGYIADGVSSEGDLHEMLTVIIRMIAELLTAKIVSLMLLDRTRSELFIKVSYGLDEWIVDQARVKVGEGIAGKVAETGMPLLIGNIESNEIYMSPNNPQYETSSLLSVPLRVNDVIVGVVNVNNKTSGQPFDQDDMNLLMSFSARISKALERMRTVDHTQAYLQDTVEAFKRLLERQEQTGAIEKTVDLATKLARKLNLTDKEVQVIQYVASVHDIGMTQISDDILSKTLNLTPEEVGLIQGHPKSGAELIRPLEFVELVSNIILHHHERVDGKGYPIGLQADEIPIGSRILSIIDAYESMVSERPYRKQLSPGDAVEELVECAGKQFDAEVVDCFIEVLRDDGVLDTRQTRHLKKVLRGAVHSGH